ncbi:MAG: rhodanese-like domain-containing protein [Bradyrhizobiaceae bacterium]|nr:rhodanese-like domain-containing protein [Bradyrhizobiaceae bacterium]
MGIFSKLFGAGSGSLADVLKQDVAIIDVRSPMEYSNGHVKGSTNIPLDQLQSSLTQLPTDKTIVFCCASGARSGVATKLAASKGLQAINGGAWTNVFQHMKNS